VSSILATREQAKSLKYYLEVQYERLVQEPDTILKEICGYLGITFSPAMLDYHQQAATRLSEFSSRYNADGSVRINREQLLSIHSRTASPPDHTRIERWRVEMSDDEQRQYESTAGPLLSRLGYATRFPEQWNK
jgi:hypothetical protein